MLKKLRWPFVILMAALTAVPVTVLAEQGQHVDDIQVQTEFHHHHHHRHCRWEHWHHRCW